jgi:hypothetical protein
VQCKGGGRGSFDEVLVHQSHARLATVGAFHVGHALLYDYMVPIATVVVIRRVRMAVEPPVEKMLSECVLGKPGRGDLIGRCMAIPETQTTTATFRSTAARCGQT